VKGQRPARFRSVVARPLSQANVFAFRSQIDDRQGMSTKNVRTAADIVRFGAGLN